jgi:hypothetical protein
VIVGSAKRVTLNARICAVIVLPMLAPMMTLTLCAIDIRPAEMNPTTITVVTDEELTSPVTIAPNPAPMKRLP